MDFEQIEDKIVTEIKNTLFIKTVETYAGQLEGDIEKMPIIFPAVFVAYGGSKLDWIDNQNFNESCTFTIFAASKNLKGSKEARKVEGCYKMIKDILTTLTNKNLGLDIERLTPVQVSFIFVSKSIAVYSIDFQTNFDNTYSS